MPISSVPAESPLTAREGVGSSGLPLAQELHNKIESRSARVGIIGLGYVGLPMTLTMAEKGYSVIGFDIDAAKIDALNQSIFSKLFDNRARGDLIAGHKAWLSYRHAFCQSESDVFEGGTEAGVLFAICEASINSEHVKDLKTFLADLSGNAG